MLEEKSIDVGPVELNYVEGPAAGPPLVVLHGGSARWQSVEHLLNDLMGEWHVFAPDLRGHGNSGRVPGAYRLQDYADDIAAFLARGVGGPAVLLGVSLGGMVGIMVAAQHPDLVRALVIGDSPLNGDLFIPRDATARERMAARRELAGGRLPLPEVIEGLKNTFVDAPGRSEPVRMRELYGEDSPAFTWMAANLFHNDPAVMTMLLDQPDAVMAGYDVDALLLAIPCPVLLLQADPATGGALSDADAQHALRLLQHPTHFRLAGSSHADLVRRPEAKQAFRDFLAAL